MYIPVDAVIVEEALRLVASAWNVTVDELRIKQKKKYYVPRVAFAYLVCEVFNQPSKALELVNVIKRPSSFRYQVRRKMKAWPTVMKKVLGIQWQIENNVIRRDSRGNPRVPHNIALIDALTNSIFDSFNASKAELKITGKKVCYVIPRRVFCHLACEVFGQPSNILHHIGLFKTYAWREFRIQTRRWWKKADRTLRREVNAIQRQIGASGIHHNSKSYVDSRVVGVAGEEIAQAWGLSLPDLQKKYSKKRALRWPRLMFGHLVCNLLLQPRDALSYLGIRSTRQRDFLSEASWLAGANPELADFVLILQKRVKEIMKGASLPPTPKWSTVKCQSIAEYACDPQ
jgi:hypothetical protein